MCLQPKLLRVIENKELIRIGSNEPIPIDVRIITSSKVELKELVDKGTFRSDLFYRLSVFRLYIPPLRERKEDIPYLLNHFVSLNTPDNKAAIDTKEINIQPLCDYDWKGNVRKLRNFADKLLLYPQEEINDKFEKIFEGFVYGNNGINNAQELQSDSNTEQDDSFDFMVENYERNIIIESLKRSFGNVNLSARLLKIKSSTLRDKVRKFKIDPTRYKR